MCRHETCNELWEQLRAFGYQRNSPGVFAYLGCSKFVMMVLERFGARKDTYNLPGGEMDPGDECCFVGTMIRELDEEVLVGLNVKGKELERWGNFDDLFKRPDGTFKFAIHAANGYGSVVFIGNPFTDEDQLTTMVEPINPQIQKNIANPNVSRCYKEVERVEVRSPNDPSKLSRFASALLRKSLAEINKL